MSQATFCSTCFLQSVKILRWIIILTVSHRIVFIQLSRTQRETFKDGNHRRWSQNVAQLAYKTDVTPAILSRNFVVQLYRATKSQVWRGVSRNFSTVAQLLCQSKQRYILCNFVEKTRWTLIGQFLFMRQSCSVRPGVSHLRFRRAIKLRDKIAR